MCGGDWIMKKAYAQYQSSAQGAHQEKVQRLVDRAQLYNVSFLQNASRAQEIFALFTDESTFVRDENRIKDVLKMWEWLKETQRNACMS